MRTVLQPIQVMEHETATDVALKVLSTILTKYDTGEAADGPSKVTVPGFLNYEFRSSYHLAIVTGQGVLRRDEERKKLLSDVDRLIAFAVESRWPRVMSPKLFKADPDEVQRDCTEWSRQYLELARRAADSEIIFSPLPYHFAMTMQ